MAKKSSKIRRLCSNDKTSSRSNICKGLIYILIGAICGIITYNPIVITDFMENYKEQYNLVVHGRKDYCTQNFESHTLMRKINQEILHQELALQKFENILKNHSKYTGIAIIGTSGIGKTLLSNLLLSNFPWKDNVQYFSWSTFGDRYTKDSTANKLLRRVSSCGHNIIVIDNLRSEDVSYVNTFNSNAEEMVKTANNRLILVYIFNIPSYTEDAETAYRNSLHHFTNLYDLEIIRFQSFEQFHLRACIKQEAERFSVSLTEEEIFMIEKTIEANHSGCKQVHSKVMIYSNEF